MRVGPKAGMPARRGGRRLMFQANGGYRGNFRRDPSQLEFQLKREAARAAATASK